MSSLKYDPRWQQPGSRTSASTFNPRPFVQQQVTPLLFERSLPSDGPSQTVQSEEEFWLKNVQVHGRKILSPFSRVTLNRFTVSDWFPRSPGTYWSGRGTRESFDVSQQEHDPGLGEFYRPMIKMSLVEDGGLGTIRLTPKRVDGERCWFATALTSGRCEGGVPLAIPEALLRDRGFEWGQTATLTGRLHFLQDADLALIAGSTRGTRPLIVFVEEIRPEVMRGEPEPVVITPVVLFDKGHSYDSSFTFVQCKAGDDAELDQAADWMVRYAARYTGTVVTNFDEQRPTLAGAPLSYQRLLAKTYDREALGKFAGAGFVERVDTLIVDRSVHVHGDVAMSENHVTVGGNAIVTIDSKLDHVTQTIQGASGLDAGQKTELQRLLRELMEELRPLEATHPDEAKEVAESAERAVATASKPAYEGKKAFLDLKASNLIEAAKLLMTVAPTVVHEAERIGRFLRELI